MSSKKILKSTGSALALGSSLASLVGQQSANADLLGSIKKWFFGDKTKNKEKKLSLKERKQKYNNEMYKRGMLEESSPVGVSLATLLIGSFLSLPVAGFAGHLAENNYAAKNIHSFSEYFDKLEDMRAVGNAVTGKALKWGFIITALTAVGLGVYSYIKQKNAEKDFKELRILIGEEDMLEKQWNLKDFQNMANSDADIKKFLKQLLVLESSSSGNNDEDVPILGEDNLDEKVQAFKNLFKNEPEKLKNNGKIYKELIDSLYSWCCGKMERLYDDSREGRYDEKKYFKAQEDVELASKIVLLREIVLGENNRYPESLSFLTSQDFYKHLIDESKPNFKKFLLHGIREYVNQEDASDEDIIEILKELTKSNQVGTIQSRYDGLTHRKVKVAVVSVNDNNMPRYASIFSKELETFSKEREEAKEKNGSLEEIYKKQLEILQGIKKFSDQKHRFSERFYRIRHSIYLNEPDEDLGIVDNLAFRAEAAYEGILKEYNNLKEAEKNK